MATSPVRVPDDVHAEAVAAARVLGSTPGALLADAWHVYVRSSEFTAAFTDAQKAIATKDLAFLKRNLDEAARKRASQRAARAAAMHVVE
jgi:hypothetical protein